MDKIVVYTRQNKMNKEDYNEALKSPQWISKTKVIKERDNYKCTKCPCKDNLEVHHTYYLKDRMPWDVPDDCLVTLCRTCHQKEHDKKPIGSFFRQKPPKEKSKNNKPLEKVKKLHRYEFIAIESDTLQEVYSKPFNAKKLTKLAKSVHGIIKGFDDKKSAELWIRRRLQCKKTRLKNK